MSSGHLSLWADWGGAARDVGPRDAGQRLLSVVQTIRPCWGWPV